MQRDKPKRIINIPVLPGEPLNGSGKVCIHLFVPDDKGLVVEPHYLHREVDETGKQTGQLVAKKTKGRLACDRKRTVAQITRNGVTTIILRSDDPRAVSCPKCIESEEYKAMMLKAT